LFLELPADFIACLTSFGICTRLLCFIVYFIILAAGHFFAILALPRVDDVFAMVKCL
jgi:hypothetical protein